MKIFSLLASLCIVSLLVASCAPIDSVRPFDQEQAAKLVKNMQKKPALFRQSK